MTTTLTQAQRAAQNAADPIGDYLQAIADRVQELLRAHEEDPKNWGYAGTIGAIAERLREIAENE